MFLHELEHRCGGDHDHGVSLAPLLGSRPLELHAPNGRASGSHAPAGSLRAALFKRSALRTPTVPG